MKTSRRNFLKSTAVAGLATGTIGIGAGCAVKAPAIHTARPSRTKPRIIFLVSDGMSMGAMSLAEVFSSRILGRGTHFMKMYQDRGNARGLFETHALNSIVTDSAAASSAWGSGSRVHNGAINMLPDGRKLKPILHLIKERGAATGLVTTVTMSHATPAGFAAIQPSRGGEEQIAPQYLGTVDVLLGGGRNVFDAARREDGVDLAGKFAAQGYGLWKTRDEMLARGEKPEKVLGLFAGGVLPYTLDQKHDEQLTAEIPTLAEMTAAALEILEKNPNGFLVQVEGGRVDHAAHENDAGALIWDQLAFDDAIGVALQFQRRHPDTLIVVTSDHGNSNPGLSWVPDISGAMDRINQQKISTVGLRAVLRRDHEEVDASVALAAIEEYYVLKIPREHAGFIADAHNGVDLPEISDQHRNFQSTVSKAVGNLTGIGWSSSNHTEDPTVIVASGPGQEQWAGFIRNSEAFGFMATPFGIQHKNPAMTYEEAMEVAGATPPYVHEMAMG